MCSQSEVFTIINQLREGLHQLFPREQFEVILFGSYTRNEADNGSDIDVLFLVDASRQSIAEMNWQVGEVCADLLLEHGIVVSPIVENRDYFQSRVNLLPFFRNIQQEGLTDNVRSVRFSTAKTENSEAPTCSVNLRSLSPDSSHSSHRSTS